MEKSQNNLMEKIVSLAKRRGFVFPGSEIYGGMANSWDYGPVGAQLKKNIKDLWWKKFVEQRADIVGLDAALIMNPKVWEASGHLANFNDPLVECKNCHERFRADQLDGNSCPNCGKKDTFTDERSFNLMFKTFIGPAEEQANIAYFRPETAQAMFVDFKNVLDSTRVPFPFGIGQIGKAFRNEITPGNFIFRTREFEQMEIEYFIREANWKSEFEKWRLEMLSWMEEAGIDTSKVHELDVPEGERAHYSKKTIDFEFDFPFGRKELFGLAYRTDFDLGNHSRSSGTDLVYTDPKTNEKFTPHVIEPTWGVDRAFLAILASAYSEEGDRVVMKFKPKMAPYKAAVFPLLSNKPELTANAEAIFNELKRDFTVAWDDRGNIGKRYYAQDEIGTPWCITVDFQTLEDGTVTVRDRDSAVQERIPAKELKAYMQKGIQG